MKKFSYEEYKNIIKDFDFVDFNELEKGKAILRHDVEYSPKRALAMAKIDNKLNIQSSFFFQVCSNSYNLMSNENRDIVYQILDMGHKIGLHVYCSYVADYNWNELEKEIHIQERLINTICEVDRFCCHRPKAWILKRSDDYICDMLNAYGQSFFNYPKAKEVKYFADSNHQWKYGYPFNENNKVQINIHPDSWSKKGETVDQNFASLCAENMKDFEETLRKEAKQFK